MILELLNFWGGALVRMETQGPGPLEVLVFLRNNPLWSIIISFLLFSVGTGPSELLGSDPWKNGNLLTLLCYF